MMTRRFVKLAVALSVVCTALCLSAMTRAQTPTPLSTPVAHKFDEFGDVPSSDKKARLDNFAFELQNNPNVRGFLIVYRSRRDLPGLNSRLANWMKDYLVYTRGFSTERLVIVDGGEASCLTQELWIVPIGATPMPRSDAYSSQFDDTEAARKFDEYYYPLLDDNVEGEGEYGGDSLEAFAAALRKEPRAHGYVIAYPQYYIERSEEYINDTKHITRRRTHLDAPSTAAKMLRTVKEELASKYRVSPARIKVATGSQDRRPVP